MIAESGSAVDATGVVLRDVGRHELVYVDCPGCDSKHSVFETTKNGFRVVRCLECSSLYVNPRPIEPELLEIYRRVPQLSNSREGQPVHDGEDARREADYRLSRLMQFVKTGRILDLGCGRGDFLLRARPLFDAGGGDIVNRTPSHPPDIPVFEGRLEDARFEPESFDAVTAIEVFEHLFDPHGALKEIHRILRPGGILLLQTGDPGALPARLNLGRLSYLHPPIHLNFLSHHAVLERLKGVGLRVIGTWSFGRAPTRTPGISHLSNPEILRPVFDLTARIGVLGRLYAASKEAS